MITPLKHIVESRLDSGNYQIFIDGEFFANINKGKKFNDGDGPVLIFQFAWKNIEYFIYHDEDRYLILHDITNNITRSYVYDLRYVNDYAMPFISRISGLNDTPASRYLSFWSNYPKNPTSAVEEIYGGYLIIGSIGYYGDNFPHWIKLDDLLNFPNGENVLPKMKEFRPADPNLEPIDSRHISRIINGLPYEGGDELCLEFVCKSIHEYHGKV